MLIFIVKSVVLNFIKWLERGVGLGGDEKTGAINKFKLESPKREFECWMTGRVWKACCCAAPVGLCGHLLMVLLTSYNNMFAAAGLNKGCLCFAPWLGGYFEVARMNAPGWLAFFAFTLLMFSAGEQCTPQKLIYFYVIIHLIIFYIWIWIF